LGWNTPEEGDIGKEDALPSARRRAAARVGSRHSDMHAEPDIVCPSSAERASVEEKNGCVTSIGRVRWQHRLRSLALPLLGAHSSPPARRSALNAPFWTASICMFKDEVHTLTLSMSPTAFLCKRRCGTHLTPSHRASMSASTQSHMQVYFLSSETSQNSAQLKQRQ
jgi:hypothetical protein